MLHHYIVSCLSIVHLLQLTMIIQLRSDHIFFAGFPLLFGSLESIPLNLWVSSSLIQLFPKELMYFIGSNLNFVLLAHLKPRGT